jgi:DNA-directed RNA polymerase I, II, and III subunit RPABC1
MEKETGLNIDDLSQEEKSKLFKVWKTLNKMMEDRGYEKDQNSNLKLEEFIEKVREKGRMNGIFTKLKKDDINSRYRTYYEYISNPKLNTEHIKNFFEEMKVSKVDSGIIILSGKLSAIAKNKIAEINSQVTIESFSLGELVVNITEHELVPKHILLTNEEKELLLKRYKIKPHQLPKIFVTDPVARYLGLKKNDVVKIVRDSETAGKYITYRIAC